MSVDKIGKAVALADITLLPEIQFRIKVDQDHMRDIAGAYKDGVEVKPVDLVLDTDGRKILADGTHRYLAAAEAGLDKIQAVVHEGGFPSQAISMALEMGLGINCGHGLKATPADKRKGVGLALGDTILRRKSDKFLARLCGVSSTLIKTMRENPDKKPGKKKKESSKPDVRVSAHTRSVKDSSNGAPVEEKSMLETRVDSVTEWIRQGSLDWPTIAEMFTSDKHVPVLIPKTIMSITLLIGGQNKQISISKMRVKRTGLDYSLEFEAIDEKAANA